MSAIQDPQGTELDKGQISKKKKKKFNGVSNITSAVFL